MQKRSHEEMLSSLKDQRLKEPFCDKNSNIHVDELNMQSLVFADDTDGDFDCTVISEWLSPVISPTNDLPAIEIPETAISKDF